MMRVAAEDFFGANGGGLVTCCVPPATKGLNPRRELAGRYGGSRDFQPMRKLLGITLGIMTALGGFVDFGQIVFTMQAGALFGYALLWAIVLGTAAIIVYMEMCGRVAVVAREPVFSVVRDCLGKRF